MKTCQRFPLAYGTQCPIRQLYKAVKYESDYQIVYSFLLFSGFSPILESMGKLDLHILISVKKKIGEGPSGEPERRFHPSLLGSGNSLPSRETGGLRARL